MRPYWTDGQATLYHGDVLACLRELPAESVHCVVTSPPYWGLRDYGTADWEGGDAECGHKDLPKGGPHTASTLGPRRDGLGPDNAAWAESKREHQYRDACGKCGAVRVDQQLGLEATPEAWVERMVEVFREVRRVMRPEATLWLNVGDSYAGSSGMQTVGSSDKSTLTTGSKQGAWAPGNTVQSFARAATHGLKPKDLCGMPWRLAFALQADGFYLRSEITWCKRAPMPESVTDRPTSATEKVFLLTKAERYFYDADAVRQPAEYGRREWSRGRENWDGVGINAHRVSATVKGANPETGRNMWNYWLLGPEPYAAAHFATFPTEIPRRAILAGTSEKGACAECGAPWRRVVEKETTPTQRVHNGNWDASSGYGKSGWLPGQQTTTTIGWAPTCVCGTSPTVPCTVLDPFIGSGTTTWVAKTLGRRGIGIDLSAEYLDLAVKRNQQMSLELAL